MKLFFIKKLQWIAVLVLWAATTNAQNVTLMLKDKTSQQTIEGAYYHLGEIHGITNSEGELTITLQDDTPLYVSHISYGKFVFEADQLTKLAKIGSIEIEANATALLPVTVVQFRNSDGKQCEMNVSLKNKLAHDAGNVLDAIPSISTIRKSGAYGFDPVLRGFKYDQINLVLDGAQTASAACPNRMDPAASQIPMNMVGRAEVMKGPHSLRYGSVFGGTINFKTTASEFTEQAHFSGRVGSSYESNGNIFRTEGVAGFSSAKTDVKIFGAFSSGNDYTDGAGVDIPAEFNRLNWGGKFGLKLSETQTLGVLVSNNFAKDVDFPALPMDLREDDTWLVNASHRAQFHQKALKEWNTAVYRTKVNHLMDNYSKVLNPRKVDAETNAETANFGGRSELHFHFQKHQFFAGIDFRQEEVEGIRTRKMLMGPMAGKVFNDNVWQDARLRRMGLFSEFHLSGTKVHWIFSGRIDAYKGEAENPAERFSQIYSDLEKNQLLPSLSVGGKTQLGQNASLGLWFGRAMRAPGIAERYINQFPIGLDPYEMLGNPQLKSEVNNQIDLVFQLQNRKTNLTINVFSSMLRDYISSEIRADLQPAMATSPGVRQFVNIDKALMTGFEVTWRQHWFNRFWQNASLVYTYGKNQDLNEPLPEIASLEFRYDWSTSLFKDKLRPEILFRKVWKQDRVARSYGERETPGFEVVDLKLAWNPVEIVTISGGIQNLFDEAYYEHLARSVRGAQARPIYSPGRNYYLTFTLNLR